MDRFMTKLYGDTKESALASQVYSAFLPAELMYVKELLRLPNARGFTREMAYTVATEYPQLAKKIIARAKK